MDAEVTYAADEARLEQARAAAKAFCAQFEFPADQIQAFDSPVLLGPVPIERDGKMVTAYRWLGGGRGGPYVQVEVPESAEDEVVVYGSDAHHEFGPWQPEPPAP